MAGGDVAKPKCCYMCGRIPCQGNCKKCSIRLKGECKELYIGHTYRDKDNNIVWYSVCADCDRLYRQGVTTTDERHLDSK